MESNIPLLIVNKGQDLIKQFIPQVVQIASQTGIQNIGTSNVNIPNTCLVSTELQKILDLRNILIDKLNSVVSIIEQLSKPLDVLTPAVNSLSTSLQVIDKARIVANAAMFIAPVIPGAAPAAINSLKDLEDIISPKITSSKNIINSIKNALDFINNILTNIINLFKSIDKYLIGCNAISISSPLTPLNSYLQNLDH